MMSVIVGLKEGEGRGAGEVLTGIFRLVIIPLKFDAVEQGHNHG